MRNIRLDNGSMNTWSAPDEGESGHMFWWGDGSRLWLLRFNLILQGAEDRNNTPFIVLSLLLEDLSIHCYTAATWPPNDCDHRKQDVLVQASKMRALDKSQIGGHSEKAKILLHSSTRKSHAAVPWPGQWSGREQGAMNGEHWAPERGTSEAEYFIMSHRKWITPDD